MKESLPIDYPLLKKIIEFKAKSEKSKRTFVANLKLEKEKNSDGGGRSLETAVLITIPTARICAPAYEKMISFTCTRDKFTYA